MRLTVLAAATAYQCRETNLTKTCPKAAKMPQFGASKLAMPKGKHILFYGTSWMRQYKDAIVAAHVAKHTSWQWSEAATER